MSNILINAVDMNQEYLFPLMTLPALGTFVNYCKPKHPFTDSSPHVGKVFQVMQHITEIRPAGNKHETFIFVMLEQVSYPMKIEDHIHHEKNSPMTGKEL